MYYGRKIEIKIGALKNNQTRCEGKKRNSNKRNSTLESAESKGMMKMEGNYFNFLKNQITREES